jgi:hypothetical protein
MTCIISHFQDDRLFQLHPLVALLVDSHTWNEIYKKVYIINSIAKSYILNIQIRPLVTEYALTIKLD